MPVAFTPDQLALINLLLRIAVMAGIASLIYGFRFAAGILVRVSPGAAAKLKLFLLLSVIFSAGVVLRKVSAQAAMDLSLEGTLLAGFLGGFWVGAGTGFVVGMTCFFLGETVAMPMLLAAGISAGAVYSRFARGGEIWNYSLNPFLIVYNLFEKLFRGGFDRNFIPFAAALLFAFIRYLLQARFGDAGLIYGYPAIDWPIAEIDLIVIVYTLGIALKLAGNTRTELIHREEEKQLVHARLSTLRSQINPHFLFNTLNSISSLIRTDSEKAREMTRRLSAIFRKSLEDQSDTHTLESEVRFLDDYLSIERVRFGDERLAVIKDLGPGTLDVRLPTLMLQPIVENAIKHGISRLEEGGALQITSRRAGGGVEIEISNEGPGFGELELGSLLHRGVGLRNVKERLDIYTCGEGSLDIESRDGGGATVRIFVPDTAERGEELADPCTDRR